MDMKFSHEKLICEALAMEAEEAKKADALGFMARALVQATIPHSAKEGTEFQRKNGAFTLTICLVPDSSGVEYKALQEVDLWAIYTMLTPRQRFESEKKYKHLKRQSLS